ncbi:MAG: TfoX/Sxy family protein [Salinisphaera sp.]|nr:TfoX/Sxy family protein [Salinisphaera sp.]
MAYDTDLVERVQAQLADILFVHKRQMFGGVVYFINGNMLCGVFGDRLMARVGPRAYAQALKLPHAQPMDFTNRPLTGFVYVAPAGIESDAELRSWLDRAIAFSGSLIPK